MSVHSNTLPQSEYGQVVIASVWTFYVEFYCLPQGSDILETCKAENVEFLVYSGLENTTQMAGIPVAHFDAKGVVEEKIQVITDAYSVDNRPRI